MLLIGRRLILRGMDRNAAKECCMEVLEYMDRWNDIKQIEKDEKIFVFGFEGTASRESLYWQTGKNAVFPWLCEAKTLASWLSWLERRPVTAEVVGSSPIGVVYHMGS